MRFWPREGESKPVIEYDQKEKERGEEQKGIMRGYMLLQIYQSRLHLIIKGLKGKTPENNKTVIFPKIKGCIVWDGDYSQKPMKTLNAELS